MVTSPADLTYTFVELTNLTTHPGCMLLNKDPREEADFHTRRQSRVGNYGAVNGMDPEHVRLIKEKVRSREATVLYTDRSIEWWTADDLPFHYRDWIAVHPFHDNDDWKGMRHLADAISVTYDTDGQPHLTVAADVQFTNANAPYIPAPPPPMPPTPPVPGTQPHWGARRVMVHSLAHRLQQFANQFANEMQFYWSSIDGPRFWATDRQLTSWIAMVREHLAILASGNTAHTVAIEVGVPSDLGRPVHQIPILEALPWMVDQLETMMSKGVLHFFDFHSDVLHSELGISPWKPTYFLWGVDGAGLASRRMVREIIEADWAATRKIEYAAARRGDPVSYTESYGEKLNAAAVKYDTDQAGLTGASVDGIREWYESWLGYGSKLHQDDEHEDEVSLVDSAGTATKVAAGEHVLAVLARHPDPQALHDAHSTSLAVKLTARELWDMDAAGVPVSRVDTAHTSAEWAQLQEQYYDGSLTNRE